MHNDTQHENHASIPSPQETLDARITVPCAGGEVERAGAAGLQARNFGNGLESAGAHPVARAFAALVLMALLLAFAAPQAAHAEVRKADEVVGRTVEDRGLSVSESPNITAQRAALISSDGSIYFSRNSDDPAQIASITKVMTAVVALDNAPDDISIPVSADAALIGESSAGLQEGDVMDLDAALKALLVPSGNDAAVAIAEAVGKVLDPSASDPVEPFVDAMNAKARELGLKDTLYENPHGLDDGEFEGELHSTAADQAIVAKCAMGYQRIRDIVGGGSTTIEVKRGDAKEPIELESTDLLLDMYDQAIGVKTGVTNSAGPSFMGAANKDGRELYAVVLDCLDEYSRFQDAENMFEWAYDHIIDLPLANTEEQTAMRKDGFTSDVPVIGEAPHVEWIDRTVKATMRNPDEQVKVFDLEGNVSQEVQFDDLVGTVNAGDKVGTITFYQNNAEIASQDLVACERVEAPNPIDTVAIWWQRLTQGLDDKTGHAKAKVYNVMPIISDNKSNAA